jgi:Rieske 2Fe-2S family protein
VGRANSIPTAGAYFLAEVAGESIIVVRDRAGTVRAFYNVCRHRAARLCSEERGQLKATVQCRYHAWTYNLEGKLVGAPYMHEDPNFDPARYGLVPVNLTIWEGLIFVNLSEQPGALAEQGDFNHSVIPRYGIADLQVAQTKSYEVQANWKLIISNYEECAHCALVHPELCDQVPLYKLGRVSGGLDYGAELGENIESLTMTGKTNRPPLPGLLPKDQHRYYGVDLYPNVFLDMHPDYMLITIMQPIAPDRTHIISEALFHPETMARADFDPSDAMDFNDLVNRQDWAVCELAQLGVSSRAFREGGLYGPYERHIREFDDWVLAKLGH